MSTFTVGRRSSGPAPTASNKPLPVGLSIISVHFPFYAITNPASRSKQWKPGGNVVCLVDVALEVEGLAYPLVFKDLSVKFSTKEGQEGFLVVQPPARQESDPRDLESKVWVRQYEIPLAIQSGLNRLVNETITDSILAEVQQAWWQDCSVYYPEAAEEYAAQGYPGWYDPTTVTGSLIGRVAGESDPQKPIPAPATVQQAPAAQVSRPATAQPAQAAVPAQQQKPVAPKRPAPASKPAAPVYDDSDLEDPFAEE